MGMIGSILVVCVGNICRSPVGERLLRAGLDGTGIKIASAGLGALAGHGADSRTAEVASRNRLSLEGHVARQFTPEMGRESDVILVMEPGHREAITRRAPELSGRCLLFDQWTGAQGIADPYRKSVAFHESVFRSLTIASDAWIARLRDPERR